MTRTRGKGRTFPGAGKMFDAAQADMPTFVKMTDRTAVNPKMRDRERSRRRSIRPGEVPDLE